MFYLRFLFFMALPEEFGQWSILTAALSHCCHCGTWFHLMFAFVQLCSIRGLAGAFCMPHSLCGATDVTFLLLECKIILFLKNKVDFSFSSTASNISCPWWQLLSLSVVPVAHHQTPFVHTTSFSFGCKSEVFCCSQLLQKTLLLPEWKCWTICCILF